MQLRELLLATALLAGATASCTGDASDARRAASAGPAAPAGSATPEATAPAGTPANGPDRSAAAVRLTGDGLETAGGLHAFGDAVEEVQPALVAALGEPTEDTGVVDSQRAYGVCPGSRLRGLEFAGGALVVLFGDVIGPGLTLYQWSLTSRGRPADVPRASAVVGDRTTYEFAVGTPLAALRRGTAGNELRVLPPEGEVFPARFQLADQSAGFRGTLTGTGDQDTVTSVLAGEPCGE